jgi:hypothetical protein
MKARKKTPAEKRKHELRRTSMASIASDSIRILWWPSTPSTTNTLFHSHKICQRTVAHYYAVSSSSSAPSTMKFQNIAVLALLASAASVRADLLRAKHVRALTSSYDNDSTSDSSSGKG